MRAGAAPAGAAIDQVRSHGEVCVGGKQSESKASSLSSLAQAAMSLSDAWLGEGDAAAGEAQEEARMKNEEGDAVRSLRWLCWTVAAKLQEEAAPMQKRPAAGWWN